MGSAAGFLVWKAQEASCPHLAWRAEGLPAPEAVHPVQEGAAEACGGQGRGAALGVLPSGRKALLGKDLVCPGFPQAQKQQKQHSMWLARTLNQTVLPKSAFHKQSSSNTHFHIGLSCRRRDADGPHVGVSDGHDAGVHIYGAKDLYLGRTGLLSPTGTSSSARFSTQQRAAPS